MRRKGKRVISENPDLDSNADDSVESGEASTPSSAVTEKRTPTNWAATLGQVIRVRGIDGTSSVVQNASHTAAAALHGWALHLYHTNEEIMISEVDYMKALQAAHSPKPGERDYQPHSPALSPYKANQ